MKICQIALTLIFLNQIKCSLNPVDCRCYMDDKDFGNSIPLDTGNGILNISPKNLAMNNNDYGKLVAIKSLIFTQKNFPVPDGINEMKIRPNEHCPKNFRIMTQYDLQVINEALRDDYFWMVSDSKQVNIPMNTLFFTQTKADSQDFSQNETAFEFYGIDLQPNDLEMNIKKISTNTNGKPKMTKCVMENYTNNEKVVMEEDLIQGISQSMSIYRTSAIDYDVNINDEEHIQGKANFKFIPKKVGCFYLKIKWKMWNGTIMTSCESFIVRPLLGSAGDTSISLDMVTETVITTVPSLRYDKIHMGHASATMSAKFDGGVYVLFTHKYEKTLRVLSLDAEMKKLNEFDLYIKGYPLSIQAFDKGFMIYYGDTEDINRSYVARYYTSGTIRWKETIMDNGPRPSNSKNQIQFFNADRTPVNGMQAMYLPSIGRLCLGRNRIMLFFAHANNFKAGTTDFLGFGGNSTISMDMNGQDKMLGDPWGASHSLNQKIAYDGKQFVTSSLGDGFPQQIVFTKNDGRHKTAIIDGRTQQQNRFAYKKASNLVHGVIPGNGKGQSCGRLGGLHVLGYHKFEKYAQVYARRECTAGIQGNPATNTYNEIGVVFFDRDLKVESTHIVGNGKNVNNIQSALYGKNIFIVYTTTQRPNPEGHQFLPDDYNNERDKCFMMLIRPDGSIAQGPIQLKKSIIGNDGMVTMHDGNVAWSLVDENGTLRVFSLKKPDNPIQITDDGQVIDTSKTPNAGYRKTVQMMFWLIFAFYWFC